MTSWSRLWPLLVIPYLALLGLGILPAGEFFGRSWGGAYVREWLLNEAVLPWLPSDAAWQLVRWFKGAHWGQEMLLYGLTQSLCLFDPARADGARAGIDPL